MAETQAKLNNLRIAPRKVRLVADLIKGMSAAEARAELTFSKKRSAPAILKLLQSAVANAKNNQKLEEDKLYIKSIRVDKGPMLKRALPRARGMATPIHKIWSHVIIVLETNEDLKPSRFTFHARKKIGRKTKEEKKETPKEKQEKPKLSEEGKKDEVITKKGEAPVKKFFQRKVI